MIPASEEVTLLRSAVAEIRQLRNANALMSARLNMFDDMMLIFRSSPPTVGMGKGEDVCWQIEKFIERIPQKP